MSHDISLVKAFKRSIAIVGAVSAGFVIFTTYIDNLSLFTVPPTIKEQTMILVRLTWIVSILSVMYATVLLSTRSFKRTLRLAILLITCAALSTIGSSALNSCCVLKYDMNHSERFVNEFVLLRPYSADQDVLRMVRSSPTESFHDQNKALEGALSIGGDRSDQIRDSLTSDNGLIAILYRTGLYVSTSALFLSILLFAWILVVLPYGQRQSESDV